MKEISRVWHWLYSSEICEEWYLGKPLWMHCTVHIFINKWAAVKNVHGFWVMKQTFMYTLQRTANSLPLLHFPNSCFYLKTADLVLVITKSITVYRPRQFSLWILLLILPRLYSGKQNFRLSIFHLIYFLSVLSRWAHLYAWAVDTPISMSLSLLQLLPFYSSFATPTCVWDLSLERRGEICNRS